jgi:uncharacterized membrane protein YidH (DUF202 family)
METPERRRPVSDLRDYLAKGRTFLAWIRTRLAEGHADQRLWPATLFGCGSRSISQTSPLKSPSTRMI